MFRPIVILAFIIGSRVCPGQSDSVITRAGNYFGIKASYNSSLIYPGMSAGAELLIKTKAVSNLKNRSELKPKIINQHLTLNINWYHHPAFHDNIYLTTEWVRRKVKQSGFYSEFSTGPGFSRTFLGGTTYRVTDGGTVSVNKLAGYSYAMVTIGGGIGYDFNNKKKTPLSAYAKMNLISMFPYNSTIYIRPVIELGVRFTVNHFY